MATNAIEDAGIIELKTKSPVNQNKQTNKKLHKGGKERKHFYY